MTETTYASSTDAIPTYAVTVTIGGSAPGDLLELGDIDFKRDVLEVTPHSATSNLKQKIGGQLDLGETTLVLRFDKAKATTFQTDLTGLFGGSKTVVFTFPFTTAETLTVSAFVSGLKLSLGEGQVAKLSCTLTFDGKTAPTWST